MKKIILSMALIMSLGLYIPHQQVDAATNHYVVQSGDSLWKIGMKHGVSVNELKKVNNKKGDVIYPGEKLVIPASISAADRDLLARLVHAEAKGEPYAGKVAVATVVLNRVDHKDFPDTIRGVIYEFVGGSYAFTPVMNGAINEKADASAYRAVDEALAFRGQGNGSIYFYNPETATSPWIKSRTITITIGNHHFAK